MSKLCQSGEFRPGDIIRSTDKKVLGNAKTGLQIIPFHYNRTWVENKLDNGIFKWDHERAFDASNANDPWEYTDADGVKCKRQKAYNIYGLLAAQTDETQLPIVKLQFKSGSLKAGRVFADFFAKLPAINKLRKTQKKAPIFPASYIWEVTSFLMKGKANDYQTLQVVQGKEASNEQIHQALQWYLTMKDTNTTLKEDSGQGLEDEVVNHGTTEEDAPF